MKHGLENVKLKTVLIYPPLFPLEGLYLGIPILKGFLKSKGYKNIESIDLNSKYCGRYSKLNIQQYFLAIKTFFNSWDIRKAICVSYNFKLAYASPSLPLNRMLDLATKNCSASEKEIKTLSRKIVPLIVKGKPDVVGISVIYPRQIFYALLIARIIKEIKKDTFIVLGGTQIGKHVNFLIRDKALLSIVDGFIEGDGEEPLAELICCLDKGKHLGGVPNFYFKKPDLKNGYYYVGTKYDYVYNPKKIVIPDFSGFKINKVLPIRASVGCPWGNCTFCTWTKFHKKNICSNPKDVLFLMKELIKKYKINHFGFIDDSLDAKFLRKFSKLILKEKIKIRWNCYLRFQPELEDEMFVKLIAKAGCEFGSFGLESMSPRILKLMNKTQKDPETIRRILRLFKKHKINTKVTAFLGFPSETEEEAKMTVDFLINEKDLYSMAILQHFALEDDSFILKNPDKFGVSRVYNEYKIGKRLGYRYEIKSGMPPEESKRLVDYTNDVLNLEGKFSIKQGILRKWFL
jgi:radical SAM superfamily enzyme YgiQ (UPF0313 family)